jgi:hypothetical protein
MPARIISLWLTTSASAGASLRVEMKNWEAFMAGGAAGGGLKKAGWKPGRHQF